MLQVGQPATEAVSLCPCDGSGCVTVYGPSLLELDHLHRPIGQRKDDRIAIAHPSDASVKQRVVVDGGRRRCREESALRFVKSFQLVSLHHHQGAQFRHMRTTAEVEASERDMLLARLRSGR